MTVSDLIKRLSAMNPEAIVVLRDEHHEGNGYDAAKTVDEVRVFPDALDATVFGRFPRSDEGAVDCVLIDIC